jgi:hypothetical protein
MFFYLFKTAKERSTMKIFSFTLVMGILLTAVLAFAGGYWEDGHGNSGYVHDSDIPMPSSPQIDNPPEHPDGRDTPRCYDEQYECGSDYKCWNGYDGQRVCMDVPRYCTRRVCP